MNGAEPFVIQAFARRVGEHPDSVAVVDEHGQYTYAEIDRLSSRFAHRLRRVGAYHEDRVGVLMHRSASMVCVVLGILKAGAAFVPLDPRSPRVRLESLSRHTQCRFLVSEHPLEWRENCEVLIAEAGPDAYRDESDAPPAHALLEGSAAYVLNTSGSTGRPRPVVVTHASLNNHMGWMAKEFGFSRLDRVTFKTATTFDASIWEMFAPLMCGGLMIIGAPRAERDPASLQSMVFRHEATILQLIPTMLEAWLEVGGFQELSSLRRVFCGGEKLTIALVDAFCRVSTASLVNLYGPTEATIDATWGVAVGSAKRHMLDGEIGTPIQGVSVWLVDENLNGVPVETEGELLLGGAALARGYQDDPQATAERFRPDAFGATPGARMYHTGDFCRLSRDGRLVFQGRRDDLIKVRGHRVELGEIRAALRLHPEVSDAVVLGRAQHGSTEIEAYVVAMTSAPALEASAIRAFLAERLPDYMLPHRIATIDRIPRTAAGKVDRTLLPPPRPRRAAGESSPESAAERQLARIWSDVLQLEGLGLDDNFFQLGGDSIKSIRVIALAKRAGLKLALTDVFEHQTIRSLALHCESASEPPPSTLQSEPFSLISPSERARIGPDFEDAYPLCSIQKALYFLSQSSPRYESYVTSFEMTADFSQGALRMALDALASRHAWLRTCVDVGSFAEPMQLVRRVARIPLEIFDLTELSDTAYRDKLHEWIETLRTRRYEWGAESFLRVAVHLHAPGTFQLTFSEPSFDGWSVSSMVAETLAIYRDALLGRELPPPPQHTTSYRDFVKLEREASESADCEAYWLGLLRRHAPSRLPRLPMNRKYAGGTPVRRRVVDVPAGVSAALQRLGVQRSLPLKSLLFAVHAKVVGVVCGTQQVVSGMMVNGRPEVEGGDELLGMFLNTVPARLDLQPDSWVALAHQAFAVERELLAYRRYPMALMQKRSGRTPLFDVAFNFTHFHVLEKWCRDADVRLGRFIAWDQTFFPLMVQFHLDASDGRLKLALDYDAQEFSESLVELWASYYASALRQMASSPEGNHAASSLGDAEKLVPRVAKAGPRRLSVSLPSLTELLSRHELLMPDAIALECECAQLTRAELARRSDELLSQLQYLGVGPECNIGIYLPMSPELVIAMLAVIKSGAAFVPLDPDAPIERVRFMVQDAEIRAVIRRRDLPLALDTELPEICIGWPATGMPIAGPPRASLDLPDALAYVLYTSGSTGSPKGVGVSRLALVNFLVHVLETPGIGATDCVVAMTAMSFDIALLELLAPLAAGARMVLMPRSMRLDAFALARCIEMRQATVVQATPSRFRMLLDAGFTPVTGARLFSGGEPLTEVMADALLTRGGEVFNLYGPTETTIWSSQSRVSRGAERVSLGSPWLNTRVELLDTVWNLAPQLGTTGQIFICGTGLARGYWRMTDATAASFLPDPLAAEEGARMYRTGDLGFYASEGELCYTGRNDEQVKIRGHRVELGEIQVNVAAFPGIQAAVVLAQPDARGVALVAYFVPEPNVVVTPEELKAFLRNRLPEVMIPRHLVALAELPLTEHGKIDRKGLPKVEDDHQLMQALASVEAMTDAEALVVLNRIRQSDARSPERLKGEG